MRLASNASILTGIVLATLAAKATAQTTYPNVKITGSLQVEFFYFDNGGLGVGAENNFFIRRARIEARGNIAKNVAYVIQPSYEGGRSLRATVVCQPITAPPPVVPICTVSGTTGFRLRDAYVDVYFTNPEAKNVVFFRIGQEKRPMGRYELTSSKNLPSIERDANQGLVPIASNNIFTAAGYLSHDVGAHIQLNHQLGAARLFTAIVGVYNGTGESLNDAGNGKSVAARVTAGVFKALNVGASYAWHEGIVGSDSSHKNAGWGVDASWSAPGEAGPYAVIDYMQAEGFTAAKPAIKGFSFVTAYNFRLKSPTSFLYAVEPAFRFDWADPDSNVADDETTLITAGVNLYVSSKAQLRFMYESQAYGSSLVINGVSNPKTVSGVRTAVTVNF